MNTNRLILNHIILILFCTHAFAQTQKVSIIPSYHLRISCNKTTNIIFPFSIQSVDRGSTDVLVEKVAGIENILHVKAGKPNFSETNLSVITTDGNLYSFLVDYVNEPRELNIAFQKDTALTSTEQESQNQSIIFSREDNNEKTLSEAAQKVSKIKRTIYGIKDKHDAMQVFLYGLYVQNDVFYFQFKVKNKSNVSYDMDAIRFFIKDRQKSKRTATQETEIQPFLINGNSRSIKGKSSETIVVALPKFTLPDEKILVVQILEKNGGRDLHFSLKNRHIMNAINIDEF
ncbi:MAG: conjugative transposon protein TraN [Chitinophagaceae bacterium]